MQPDLNKKLTAIHAYCQGLTILRKENAVKLKQFRGLAEPLRAYIFSNRNVHPRLLGPRGKLTWFVDLLWGAGFFSKEEEWPLRKAAYAGLSPGGSCKNGRWGWVRHWQLAVAFTDAELAGKVLDDFRHWLGHDI